jgi:hypothetical protein
MHQSVHTILTGFKAFARRGWLSRAGLRSRLNDSARQTLLRMMPKGSVCAEIGVWEGEFSQRILHTVQPRRLHLIDPWQYQGGEKYRLAWYGGKAGSQAHMDALYGSVCRRFKREVRAGQVIIHRQPSGEAAVRYPDGYFDWVYVDGNHLYEFVRNDLELYAPKIKIGGYLAGDDYAEGYWWQGGVKRAVDEFLGLGHSRMVWLHHRQFVLQMGPDAPT